MSGIKIQNLVVVVAQRRVPFYNKFACIAVKGILKIQIKFGLVIRVTGYRSGSKLKIWGEREKFIILFDYVMDALSILKLPKFIDFCKMIVIRFGNKSVYCWSGFASCNQYAVNSIVTVIVIFLSTKLTFILYI